MSKTKSTFFCQSCGASAAKWIGKCPACGQWNSYVEEVIIKEDKTPEWNVGSGNNKLNPSKNKPKTFADIDSISEKRLPTLDGELDRVLGGGIVTGSLILLGGEPGIGKSTLLLQMAVKSKNKVLYLSGEESETQIKMRAERVGINNEECYILSVTNIQTIFQVIKELQPEIVIIDSIQTLYTNHIDSAPGSISQIRRST